LCSGGNGGRQQKYGFGVVGRAIAREATDASLDDTVNVIFELRVLVVGRYCVSLLREKRLFLEERRGCDVRLTAKHGAVAVLVVVVRAIAWKTAYALLDDTVDGVFGVVNVLAVLVLVCVLGLVLDKRLEE